MGGGDEPMRGFVACGFGLLGGWDFFSLFRCLSSLAERLEPGDDGWKSQILTFLAFSVSGGPRLQWLLTV